ncbi:MAG TPA: hypothetical protein VFI65_04910, partial [Streptosporangiaceae bacterium]|nr:hypothetical protein [Streptosporangiaceae bacterium]
LPALRLGDRVEDVRRSRCSCHGRHHMPISACVKPEEIKPEEIRPDQPADTVNTDTMSHLVNAPIAIALSLRRF